jgi:rRNA-processing protein FCF1
MVRFAMAQTDDTFDIFVIERVFPNAEELFSLDIPPLESVRSECDVVLDTNVLLLPYTTGSNSLKQIQKIYESLKSAGHLFVPSQVAREFARHRAIKLLEVLKALRDKSSLIQKPSIGSYPLLDGLSEYSEVLKIEKQIGEQIKAYRDTIGKLLGAITKWEWNDPVAAMYRSIFSSDIIRAPSFGREEIEKELEYRTTNKVPPGYKDASKDDSGVGDLLIWMTILEIGEARKKPLIFVTGEEKADWQYNRGLLPRYELIDEFRRKSSGNAFYIASFSAFLELFDAPEEVVSAVREQEETMQLQVRSTSSASVKVNLIEGLSLLMERATAEPRGTIKRTWELLGGAILRAARVPGENVQPDSEEISTSLKLLETSYPELIRSIRNFQTIARKVVYQSQWACDPSPKEAERFILQSAAARNELGDSTAR